MKTSYFYLNVFLLFFFCHLTMNELMAQNKCELSQNSNLNSIIRLKTDSTELDITTSFVKEFDVSPMFLEEYFGAFGKNYRRIDLYFKNVNKRINAENSYYVMGTTILKHKEVPFAGEIILKKVIKSRLNPYNEIDSSHCTIYIDAEYRFIEDKSINGSGVFEGSLFFTLVLVNGSILNNELWDWLGDGYSNFQFQGIWKSPKGSIYNCIFGDGRLDNSGDLDVGTGEFTPNVKYHKFGWHDYNKRLEDD